MLSIPVRTGGLSRVGRGGQRGAGEQALSRECRAHLHVRAQADPLGARRPGGQAGFLERVQRDRGVSNERPRGQLIYASRAVKGTEPGVRMSGSSPSCATNQL